MTHIVVEIKGGLIIRAVSNQRNVNITIIDFDSLTDTPSITGQQPDLVLSDAKISEYVKKRLATKL
ncbi:MAG TPA: hypothetical protein VIQ51_18440 [Chryseosolibacter sp.]|jgi:hypothetical protein